MPSASRVAVCTLKALRGSAGVVVQCDGATDRLCVQLFIRSRLCAKTKPQ